LPDVLFEFDSARLTRGARGTVGEIADVLRAHPERLISVEGHTDSSGTVEYNSRLSEQRARSVASELSMDGVSRRNIRVRGFGESQPVSSNRTEAGRSRNRRVEVVIENEAR
jgi:outer membrane protein OmpA-like peptidoglycan-associated protein